MDLSQVKAKVFMPISKGEVVKVDFVDWYEKLRMHKWHCSCFKNLKYARSAMGVRLVGRKRANYKKMHRVIMGVSDPQVKVDHIDGNGLNNSRTNLRLCSQAENCRNRAISKLSSTGFSGVSVSQNQKRSKEVRYTSRIGFNGKRIWIGAFDTAEEAAQAYNEKAKELFGEFASLNCISR